MRLIPKGYECMGFLEGWRGVLENMTVPLTVSDTDDLIREGGTALGSSRTNPFKKPEKDVPKILKAFKDNQLHCLVALGGDDTLGVGTKLWKEHKLPIIGVPKTIDNDLSATDFTFGFNTAVENCIRDIDRLVSTTKSHRRVMVIEVMGRHAGWIAAYAGMASGAEYTLVPEVEPDIDEMCEAIKRARARGKNWNLVVVSEGAKLSEELALQSGEKDSFGHVRLGGIGKSIAKLIEDKTGFETRDVVLGHLQRGGNPTAWDRILSTRYGYKAAELVEQQDWGKMVALRGNDIVAVGIEEGTGATKTLDMGFYEIMKSYFA
jgi:6-phosphofructokinase 1